MTPRRLDLHIEELVLDGVAADAAEIGPAVERELTRLVAERGFPGTETNAAVPPSLARDVSVARVDGGTVDLDSGSGTGLGARIADAVYGSLKP